MKQKCADAWIREDIMRRVATADGSLKSTQDAVASICCFSLDLNINVIFNDMN